MKLRELTAETPYVLETRGDLDTEILEITSDSKDRTDHGLFSVSSAPGTTRTTMPGRLLRTAARR